MHFCFEHSVPLPPETVFRFFENPMRLELLHEGWSRIRVLRCEDNVHIGSETWVEVNIAGFIPLVLGFRHFLFEPHVRFGERLIHGPFATFTHIHEFHPQDSGTLVRDLLEISLPRHYGGEVAMRHIVEPEIKRSFHHRAEALDRLALGVPGLAGKISEHLGRFDKPRASANPMRLPANAGTPNLVTQAKINLPNV